MLIDTHDFRITLLERGLLLFVLAYVMAAVARRLGGIAPALAGAVGALSSVVAWAVFWLLQPHGQLLAPLLFGMTAACPLLAAEPGRWLPVRTFNWVALATLVAGGACDLIPSPGVAAMELQEALLLAGLVLPIPAAVIVFIVRRTNRRGAAHRRR